jgi:hypothetical protein
MTPISSFYPWVMPYVPGCPDPLLDQAIRSAANDLSTRSDLVQRVIVADVVSGTQDYTIIEPTDFQYLRILSVGFQGTVLGPVSPDVVNSDVALRNVTIGTASPITGNPTWFFQKTPSDAGFSLYPVPNANLTGGLTVKVSFQPANTATTLDDILFSDWAEEIAAGAIAILMAMPGQQFSNTTAAEFYRKAAEAGIARAKRVSRNGKMVASQRVMPVSFAF